jgi:hypothetical protein
MSYSGPAAREMVHIEDEKSEQAGEKWLIITNLPKNKRRNPIHESFLCSYILLLTL